MILCESTNIDGIFHCKHLTESRQPVSGSIRINFALQCTGRHTYRVPGADRCDRLCNAMECEISHHKVYVPSSARGLSVASSGSQSFLEPFAAADACKNELVWFNECVSIRLRVW